MALMITGDWRDAQPAVFERRSLPRRILASFADTVQALGFMLLDSQERDLRLAARGEVTVSEPLLRPLGQTATHGGEITADTPPAS